jgi:DNA polymerase III epsilon subunit-like protein
MPIHMMIDLETMGTGSDAAILSLGAVKFDPMAAPGTVEDCFHVGISLESCVAVGLKIDPSTIVWWMHKDRDAARTALNDLQQIDLWEALDGFSAWFGPSSMPVWGNGATFDNVILRSAFAHTRQECPWKFWDDKCYRTLKGLAPGLTIERTGTHHSALDDALSQAKHMQAITSHLNLTF